MSRRSLASRHNPADAWSVRPPVPCFSPVYRMAYFMHRAGFGWRSPQHSVQRTVLVILLESPHSMTVPALSSGRRSAHPRRSDHSVRRACQCAVATIFDISAHSHAGPLGLGSCFEESRSVEISRKFERQSAGVFQLFITAGPM